jgi:hypothetical protein
LTPEIQKKIHILAAPQYKPWADFHKKKVPAYFYGNRIFELITNLDLFVIKDVNHDLFVIMGVNHN